MPQTSVFRGDRRTASLRAIATLAIFRPRRIIRWWYWLASRDASERGHLLGVPVLVVIGIPLVVLAPAKQPVERLSALVS